MTERASGLGGDLCGYFIDRIRANIILAGALVFKYILSLCESEHNRFNVTYDLSMCFRISNYAKQVLRSWGPRIQDYFFHARI